MNAFVISLILFFIPFFWFSPGELDMGGDSSRLWLVSPMDYLRATAIYVVDPQGTAKISVGQYHIPYLLMLAAIRSIFGSTNVLVGLEKGLKLSLSFLFVYLLVRDILYQLSRKKLTNAAIEGASFVSGIWYALSGSVTVNMAYALLTHNQVFVNPMMIWFFFRFLVSKQQIFLWLAIHTSVLFAPNFSLVAPPQLFAFFPLAIIFVIGVSRFVLGIQIPWKRMIVPVGFFLIIHAFHLLPEIGYLANPGSQLYGRAFGLERNSTAYFDAILGLGKVSAALLQPPFAKNLTWTAIVPLLVILFGMRFNTNPRLMRITSIFFLGTLILLTANVTSVVVWIYRKFYMIPGFGMFRNFIGVWQFVYTFFYALLLGFSFFSMFARMKKHWITRITVAFVLLVVIQNWSFLRGSIAKIKHGGTNARIAITMDPQYESVLQKIRTLPPDGKILTLPFTDYYFQVLGGTNNGVYVGPSTISYVTGRNDFSGYQIMTPFTEDFMKFTKNGEYESIRRIFSLLNIRYIFHNTDPAIYDEHFPGFPYSYVRGSLPNTQAEYSDFIQRLGGRIFYEIGPYRLYELEGVAPLFYSPKDIRVYESKDGDWRMVPLALELAYIDVGVCNTLRGALLCEDGVVEQDPASVTYRKINPTKYQVIVNNASTPKVLVFSNQYNTSWNMAGLPHVPINGFSNAWMVTNGEYTVEMTGQRFVATGLWISGIGMIFFIIWPWYNARNRTNK